MKHNIILLLMVAVFGVTTAVFCENWTNYEGFQHQLSSPIDLEVSPATVEIKWEKVFDTTFSFWEFYDQNFIAFNLTYYNGMMAFSATTETGITAGYDYNHIIILDTSTGQVLTCIDSPQKHGFSPGACEFSWGRGPVVWDPESEILYQCIGGDHPWNSACLPLESMKQYTYDPATGDAVPYVAAFQQFYADYPGFKSVHGAVLTEEDCSSGEPPMGVEEWSIGTFGPTQHASNRSAAFDLQPGSSLITCAKGTGHNKASSAYQTNKFTGRAAREDWDQFTTTETGWPVWKHWYSSIVSGNRVYYMGPYDPALSIPDNRNAQIGLHLTGIEFEFQDNQDNDGYTGRGYKETAHPLTPSVFDYFVETESGTTSWPGTGDGTGQLQFLAEDDGVWAVWRYSESQPFELVHANASGIYRYALGSGTGEYLSGTDALAYTDCGADGEYLVFFDSGTALNVFSKTGSTLEWTYDLAANYPAMNAGKMVVAGKYALLAWFEEGTNCELHIVSFDITGTAPGTPPTPWVYELTDVPAATWYCKVRDIIAVNGTAYILAVQDLDSSNTVWLDIQRVIAIETIGRSSIDPSFTVSPSTGPARLVTVCDASGATTTDIAGIITYEWDFDYDYVAFTPDATGVTVSHVYTYDTVNTDQNNYAVALRITDSTGHSELRTAKVSVTPDAAGNQTATFAVIEECDIAANDGMEWSETAASGPRMRCSGTYGGSYETGEHSRGYMNFETVTLDPSYTLVQANLKLNIVRTNGSNTTSVHRMKSTENIDASSVLADIMGMTGVDQDTADASIIEPLDTFNLANSYVGSAQADITDAVAAWLGRSPYTGLKTQSGLLLCVDGHSTPGTIASASYYSGETASHQWDWDPGEAYIEIIYIDPTATTPETLGNVIPAATAAESYANDTPIEILWSGSGPIDNVDIEYSTISASGGWTALASNEVNDGRYTWDNTSAVALNSVISSTVWIRVIKNGGGAEAVSANSFVITASGSTYSISGTVSGAEDTGVTVTLGGNGSGTYLTTSGGAFSFSGLPDGTYTLTASLVGYTFSDPGNIVISGGDQTGISITSTAVPTYTISGTVSGAEDTGVTVTLGGAGSGSVVTLAGGAFSFSGLADGTYTLTASLSGYTFSDPGSIVVSGGNQTGITITSTAVTTGGGGSSTDSGSGCGAGMGSVLLVGMVMLAATYTRRKQQT